MKTLDKLDMVNKPTRYIGSEINSVVKENLDELTRFAFVFPDIYEIGMSHLGLQIIYGLINKREDSYCERVFSVSKDLEDLLLNHDEEIFTLETKTPISQMNFIGFTLQYELSYTNILKILELGKIPFYSKDREENHPLIIGGGPCVYSSEAIADFFDIMIIGEAEEVLEKVLDIYNENKDIKKKDFLKLISKLKGVYIPSFYNPIYKEDGTIEKFDTLENASLPVEKVIVNDLNKVYYPDNAIIPFAKSVHDRVTVEIFRGCSAGCRFCQAGMIYRPVRERNHNNNLEIIKKQLQNTGYDEVSLSSLSTGDYTELQPLLDSIINEYKGRNIGISLPSLRLDSINIELLEKVQSTRKSGITFAPEAGSQRMRDVINKNITEEDLLVACKDLFEKGWSTVKLYFMIGLPYETDEDILAIATLVDKVKEEYYKVDKAKRHKNLKINVSASAFVPKAFTPYQWFIQNTIDEFKRKQFLLKDAIRDLNSKSIKFKYHDPQMSFLEGVFSRGDRRLSKVIVQANKLGLSFDSWDEHFNFDTWMKAFDITGIDPLFYNQRDRQYDEIMPWDIINIGINKEYLIDENEKSKAVKSTMDCRKVCNCCGMQDNICNMIK